jgi:hypothetical protein
MSYSRNYLLEAFNNYDYHNATRPWENNYRAENGLRNCAWQMQAFHYFWCEKQCKEEGLTALSLNIPNLPHCNLVSNEPGVGQFFCDFTSVHRLVNPKSFPLIIASAAISFLLCDKEGYCDGSEVAKTMKDWMSILKPGGILAAVIMDEKLAFHEGRTMKGQNNMTHTWTAIQFERAVLSQLVDTVEIVEYDSFHNGCSFNMVLMPKG